MNKYENYNGKVIRQCRSAKGISQEELGFMTNIDASSIGKLERNEASPTVTTLARIAAALDFPLAELFQRDDDGNVENNAEFRRIRYAFVKLSPEERKLAADIVCGIASIAAKNSDDSRE